jgi:hypothetical protein
MQDRNYLRGAAAQCGNRLDALRLEREAAERGAANGAPAAGHGSEPRALRADQSALPV